MEEEGSSVRLVRCPKCENLLPELPEYSVYQCGGCGAVLRGKQSTPAREKRPLERSDNEKKEKASLESASVIERENDEFELGRRQGKTVHEKISKLSASSSSKKEKRERFTDSDQIRKRRLDFDQTKVKVFNDWDMNVPNYGESQEIRHPFGPIRSRTVGIHRNSSTVERDRFGNLPYSNEGPSSSHSFGGLNELTRVQDLENDRAQLLQKLDELRTQLTRSCNVTENPNGRLTGSYPWPHQPPHHQYLPPTYHDPFLGYNQDTLFHRPSCSCSQCYNTNWHSNTLPKIRPFPSFNSLPAHDPLTYGQRQLPRHLDTGTGSFGRRYPRRRVILSHGGERVSRPVSGGAPFISCCNCFELLKIPKKLWVMEKNVHKKMKCAVCSSLISITLEDNRIVTSVSSSQQKVNKTKSNPSVHSSRDYDKSGYNFQLADTEPNLSPNEQSPDAAATVIDKASLSMSNENLESQNNDLSQSQRRDEERVLVENKKSLKDALVATEIDVSLTEYLNCEAVSKDKEDDQLRNKKGGTESFFAGLIKKRLKDFSRSSSERVVEKGRSDVFVNGQLLTDRQVKKAEKLAGPIHPGEFWYDPIAGFWGVMNQPCLGIIPPFIEEFDYPLPKNCGAGNTRVFVNGRELNQKDLDLLAGRGLPTTKDKSYIIDISGKVVDEDTGEELDGLGKLAPTVERVKHGFGMKVPKTVVSK
ncbi:uncharacterized protein LOC111894298 [Lactuca sativa]|uniref:Zinc-ribbon domain-containing protein n=1 Tax=Lactuca sativa TaxID=4236 RepID=A0A9R1XLS1_LACSA|nr:uncharacterized protein LOC111894298 [Lactuca sativa]KAJ0217851.1 hypothetical protein LSAT_V11C300105530 [Lactuca sativa]